MTILRRTPLVLVTVCVLMPLARAAEPRPLPAVHPDIRREAERAIALGLQWLEAQQRENGSWSLEQFPAITALAAQALLNDPSRAAMELRPPARRALAYVAACAREDGGIYKDVPTGRGGGLRNYNTAICMTALAASGDIAYDPVVRRAREFLARLQQTGQDIYHGGFGYDNELNRPYADMVNTLMAVEAFKFTQFVVDGSCRPSLVSIQDRPAAGEGPRGDPDWAAAVAFLSRCQNLPGDAAHAVSPRPEDRGGFFYEPNRGMAEGGKDAEGRVWWQSYGTSTYGGLMCLLYADLDRNDPRITGAVDWVRRHWTVEEHPGLGQQGLYFYYMTTAKALRAWGEDPLRLSNGRAAAWREELAVKLASLQRKDPQTGLGFWVNDTGRWMENDPVLVTSYAVLALEMLIAHTAP